ncbi:hypothetical protein [Hymenobacter koreensis]|uniref:Uncharacterized protein n=1 Tax=Hymenobacter koreensis TaxID=1084523 RepID=A0ABP8JJY3_9BACT
MNDLAPGSQNRRYSPEVGPLDVATNVVRDYPAQQRLIRQVRGAFNALPPAELRALFRKKPLSNPSPDPPRRPKYDEDMKMSEWQRVQAQFARDEAEYAQECVEMVLELIELRDTDGLKTADRWFRHWPLDVFCARLMGKEWRPLLPPPGTQTSLV